MIYLKAIFMDGLAKQHPVKTGCFFQKMTASTGGGYHN
jgi:hypothetical protein